MKWLSFDTGRGMRPGVLLEGDRVLDLGAAWPEWAADWRALLAGGQLAPIAVRVAQGRFRGRHLRPLAELTLGAPVPEPSKVIALGRNYPSHAAEQTRPAPTEPLLFAKAPSCLVGHGAPVILPPHEAQPDYEAEMALVIGRRAKDLARAQALTALAGVTAFNDVSGRQAQFGDRVWLRGKSFDTFGPVGPWVVTLDEVPDPDDLALSMRVNGEVRQAARTSEMTVDCAAILAYVSRQMTLLPGDLIATGTPAGVGVFRDPPLFLQAGDWMEVTLEGVGVLANPVLAAGRQASRDEARDAGGDREY